MALIAAVVIWPHTLTAASFVYVVLDVPESSVSGINDAGQIVGAFSGNSFAHGFFKDGARVEIFDVADGGLPSVPLPPEPFFIKTLPTGISASGRIVGRFEIWRDPEFGVFDVHGFVKDGDAFTVIDFPGTTVFNRANGISPAGVIVGAYGVGTIAGGLAQFGYRLDASGFQTIEVPGSLSTEASGINDNGQIVGVWVDPTLRQRGLLMDGGAFRTIDAPGFEHTALTGINDAGQIVGVASGVSPSGSVISGSFLLDGDGFTDIAVPGALFTFVHGINNAGQIVGDFFSPTAGSAGFVATPGGAPGLTVATVAREVDGVRVRLDATSAPRVRALVFSLTGAMEGSGTVDGPVASVFIAGAGETTLTYAAIDDTGVIDAPASVTVSFSGGARLVVSTPAGSVRLNAPAGVEATAVGGPGAPGMPGSSAR